MKAISLISGGLDSILAARLIQDQGVEVIPVNFAIPFCHRQDNGSSKAAALVKGCLDKELRTVDIKQEFLQMLQAPRHGFGSNMNPCIDCKILMLSKAKGLLREWKAEFVVTGEVLGQRPMSQHRQALDLIAKQAGVEGFVVRPLSAKLLNETIPEQKGWLNRLRLLSFSGRGRRPQMELANNLGIQEYSQPGGGCLLTDPGFSSRLKDLIAHDALNGENIELLKLGRHFRLSDKVKLIVGRNEKENELLEGLARDSDYLFFPHDDIAGPTALGRGKFTQDLIALSSKIVCRYCDLNGSKEAAIAYCLQKMTVPFLGVAPLSEELIKQLRI